MLCGITGRRLIPSNAKPPNASANISKVEGSGVVVAVLAVNVRVLSLVNSTGPSEDAKVPPPKVGVRFPPEAGPRGPMDVARSYPARPGSKRPKPLLKVALKKFMRSKPMPALDTMVIVGARVALTAPSVNVPPKPFRRKKGPGLEVIPVVSPVSTTEKAPLHAAPLTVPAPVPEKVYVTASA